MILPFDSDPILKAELTTVVYVEVWRGNDTQENPRRIVMQYWSPDGRFLAEYDPTKYAPEPDDH